MRKRILRYQCSRNHIKNEETAILMGQYRSKGLPVTRMLILLRIPGSSCYRKPSLVYLKSRGKPSRTTDLSSENEITIVPESEILAVIRDHLGREFVCYGYKKVTRYLQRPGYKINRKKVFRILKKTNLLILLWLKDLQAPIIRS